MFEVRKPFVRRRAMKVLFLLSAMSSVAGCKNSPYKSPEDVKEPTPNEESITLQEEVTSTPTNKPKPSYTPTPTETPTPAPTETPTRIPTSEDWHERGYSIHDRFCSDSLDAWCSALVPYSGRILDYRIEGDEIVFNVKIRFYNLVEFEEEVRTKEFAYSTFDYDDGSDEYQFVGLFSADSEIPPLINPKSNYRFEFFIKGYPEFSSELIEDFINGDIDLDFELREIDELKNSPEEEW